MNALRGTRGKGDSPWKRGVFIKTVDVFIDGTGRNDSGIEDRMTTV